MTRKQKLVLGLTTLAPLMVARDPLVDLTTLSTIRLHAPSETHRIDLGPDR